METGDMGEKQGARKSSGRASLTIMISVFLVISMVAAVSRISVVHSTNALYTSTEHGGTDVNGNSVTGVSRPANTPVAGYTISTTDFPAGGCIHCHDEHGSYEGISHTVDDYMPFASGNTMCNSCHVSARATGGSYTTNNQVWQGSTIYNGSGHGTSGSAYWPGATPAARTAAEAGYCVNCHYPHGNNNTSTGDNLTGQVTLTGANPTLNMLTRIEENLCLGCHSTGAPATTGDIQTPLNQGVNSSATPAFYNHPVNRDNAGNDRSPSYHNIMEAKAATNSSDRHVECVDCHNPHYAGYGGGAGPDTHTLGTNVASPAIYGTWGVRPSAGDPTVKANWPTAAVGTLPAAPAWSLNYIDSGTDYEWELCMRCHSNYSYFPTFSGADLQTDVSREINPNNLSHHAIVRPGNNQLTSAPAATITMYDGAYTFANPRSATVYCSDCHTTDQGSAITATEGPHGSSNKFIIGSWCEARGGAYGTATCTDSMQTSICFKCHKYDVYWNGTGTAAQQSRMPNHDGNHQQPDVVWGAHLHCMACHGGGTPGGIHGSNESFGTLGGAASSNRGYHFTNGACLESFTYKNAMGRMECWTVTAATTYCLSTNTCVAQHSAKATAANYDYCEPTCPGN